MTNSQQRIPSNRVARSLYYFLHESVPFLRNGNNEVATVLDLTRRFISPPVEYVIFEQAPSDLLARSVSFPVSWARTCMCAWFSRCSCTRHERGSRRVPELRSSASRASKKSITSRRPAEWHFFFSFLSSLERTILFAPRRCRRRHRGRVYDRRPHGPANECYVSKTAEGTHRRVVPRSHGNTGFVLPFPLFGFHSIRQALAKIAAVIPPEDVPGKGTSRQAFIPSARTLLYLLFFLKEIICFNWQLKYFSKYEGKIRLDSQLI